MPAIIKYRMTNKIRDNGFTGSKKSEAVNKAYPWIMNRMAGISKVLFLSVSKQTKRMIALIINATISMNSFEIRVANAEAMDAINVKKTIGNRKLILICFASSPTLMVVDNLVWKIDFNISVSCPDRNGCCWIVKYFAHNSLL